MTETTTNELFNSKSTMKDVLKYSITEIAKFRWIEYSNCWSLGNFIWWEYERIGKDKPDLFKDIAYWDQAKPKIQLAEDLIIYAKRKTELINFINRVNLTDRLMLHYKNHDEYAEQIIQLKRDRLNHIEAEFRIAQLELELRVKRNLKPNEPVTHLKIVR